MVVTQACAGTHILGLKRKLLHQQGWKREGQASTAPRPGSYRVETLALVLAGIYLAVTAAARQYCCRPVQLLLPHLLPRHQQIEEMDH